MFYDGHVGVDVFFLNSVANLFEDFFLQNQATITFPNVFEE